MPETRQVMAGKPLHAPLPRDFSTLPHLNIAFRLQPIERCVALQAA